MFYALPYRVLFHDTMAYGTQHFLTNFKLQCEARERLLFSSLFSYCEHLPTSLEVTRCPRRSAALAITR